MIEGTANLHMEESLGVGLLGVEPLEVGPLEVFHLVNQLF